MFPFSKAESSPPTVPTWSETVQLALVIPCHFTTTPHRPPTSPPLRSPGRVHRVAHDNRKRDAVYFLAQNSSAAWITEDQLVQPFPPLFVFFLLSHTHAPSVAGPPCLGRFHIPTLTHAFGQGIKGCGRSNYEVLCTRRLDFYITGHRWRYQNHTIRMRCVCVWVWLHKSAQLGFMNLQSEGLFHTEEVKD